MWYGPDTYMGSNLAQLFLSLAELPDEDVKLVHPGAHVRCRALQKCCHRVVPSLDSCKSTSAAFVGS